MSSNDQTRKLAALEFQIVGAKKSFTTKLEKLGKRLGKYKRIQMASKRKIKNNKGKSLQTIKAEVDKDPVVLLDREFYFNKRDIYAEYIQYRNLELLKLIIASHEQKPHNILNKYYNNTSTYRNDIIKDNLTNRRLEFLIFNNDILTYKELTTFHANGLSKLLERLIPPAQATQNDELKKNIDLYEKNNRYVSDVIDLRSHYEKLKLVNKAASNEYHKQQMLNPLLIGSSLYLKDKITQYPPNATTFIDKMKEQKYLDDGNTIILFILYKQAKKFDTYIQIMDNERAFANQRQRRMFLPQSASPYYPDPPIGSVPSHYAPPGSVPSPYPPPGSAPSPHAPPRYAASRRRARPRHARESKFETTFYDTDQEIERAREYENKEELSSTSDSASFTGSSQIEMEVR